MASNIDSVIEPLAPQIGPGDYIPAVALRPKVEHFAQLYASCGIATRAYRAAFDVGPDTKAATVRQRAYELVHEPAVAERVRQLLAQASEGTTISARARMLRLQDIVEADPSELVSVVVEPCAKCWPDDALAIAADHAIATGGDLPNPNEPQSNCASCRGHGVHRVVITPTEQLSAGARKLLKGVRQKSDGSIEVTMHDQLAASDQLNRMQSIYVDRSASIVAHVHVEPLRDMTPAEVAELIHQQKLIR